MSTRKVVSRDYQKDTPTEWILGGRMFRLKTWELSYNEIESAITKLIPKESFELNVIQDKDENKKEISCLLVKDKDSIEKIRTNELVTTIGKVSKLKKVSHIKNNLIESRTIKTTAPTWVTKEMIFSSFLPYSSDKKIYKVKVDKNVKLVQYPIIRVHPKKVLREGEMIDVNVIYVQFSPNSESKDDAFIAVSMKHRLPLSNKNNSCVLLFDNWTKEKKLKKDMIIYDDLEN